MNHPAGTDDATSAQGAQGRRPDLAHGRILWIAAGVSLALHLAALWAYPRLLRRITPEPERLTLPTSSVVPEGMRVIRIIEIAEVPEPAPVAKRPVEKPKPVPEPRPRAGEELERRGPPSETTRPTAAGRSAAERLRPHLQDRHLWGPLNLRLNELTTEQREELELSGRIAAWQDSVAAAEEAARAGTDWTHTDAQGRKWGVSPGKIHLGDITLPLPFFLGAPVGRRDEIRDRQWKWDEIQRGAARGAVRDSWKARAEAIRKRRDAERAKKKARTKPDTTRSRRR